MSKRFNPMHWECSVGSDEPAKIVDLRTLPDEIKVEIIQAALNVSFRYCNGDYDVEEGSEEHDALAELAMLVDRVRDQMHAVDLIPLPLKGR